MPEREGRRERRSTVAPKLPRMDVAAAEMRTDEMLDVAPATCGERGVMGKY